MTNWTEKYVILVLHEFLKRGTSVERRWSMLENGTQGSYSSSLPVLLLSVLQRPVKPSWQHFLTHNRTNHQQLTRCRARWRLQKQHADWPHSLKGWRPGRTRGGGSYISPPFPTSLASAGASKAPKAPWWSQTRTKKQLQEHRQRFPSLYYLPMMRFF
jgi:hypothetical protein